MVTVIALGGSTNAVLHLIAMARAANINLTIEDFEAVTDRTPVLADLKPSGKYVMEDLHNIGGTPAVINKSDAPFSTIKDNNRSKSITMHLKNY